MCCIRRKRRCDNFVNKKLDRRKRYTRMVLRDNLMLLLKKKQLSSITVKELCEKADINRSTFYDHFKDVFHLMDRSEEHTSELQSRGQLVCRLLLDKKIGIRTSTNIFTT